MRPLDEREEVINLYFHEGKGFGEISHVTGLSKNTVKSWCRRYRIANEIPKRGHVALSKEPVRKESLRPPKPRKDNSPTARIERLEMEVELLRNFLILADEK